MLQLTSARSLGSPQRNSLLALGTRLRRDLKVDAPLDGTLDCVVGPLGLVPLGG